MTEARCTPWKWRDTKKIFCNSSLRLLHISPFRPFFSQNWVDVKGSISAFSELKWTTLHRRIKPALDWAAWPHVHPLPQRVDHLYPQQQEMRNWNLHQEPAAQFECECLEIPWHFEHHGYLVSLSWYASIVKDVWGREGAAVCDMADLANCVVEPNELTNNITVGTTSCHCVCL